MPRSKVKQGADFERSILNKLREIGYDGIRSAGSHGCADVIVWKDTERLVDRYPDISYYENDLDLYLIQCKHSLKNDANLKTLFEEENVKILAAMPDKFTKVLCIKQPRSRNILQFVFNGYDWKLKTVFKI